MSAGRTWLPALRYLQRRSEDWAQVLNVAGLDAAAVEDLDARVPTAAGCKLLRAAAAHLDEPLFGLHAASVVDRATFGLIELVVASQPDRDAAIEATTASLKQVKTHLQAQGFDPAVITDDLYVLDGERYVPLDDATFRAIQAAERRL